MSRVGIRFVLCCASVLGLVLATGCGVNGNKRPKADLQLSPGVPHAGNETTLDGSLSVDPDGHITNYIFEFGDGATQESVDPIVVHTYDAENANLTIRLTVVDNKGARDTVEIRPNGGVANDEPTIIVIASPNPADKFETITIDASNSYDDTEIVSYTFEFGDGDQITQTSPIATHSYNVVNFADTSYTLRVRGVDDRGKEGRTDVEVDINDLPPSVSTVDPGLDGLGVIGEWIHVIGKNVFDPPEVLVDGVASPYVEVIDEFSFRFRVPPRARSGLRNLDIVWPGYEGFYGDLMVRRYATIGSPLHDKTYFLDVNGNETVSVNGLEEALPNATRVKISPDGSTAYVADGRFNLQATGNVAIVDLTTNDRPAVLNTFQVGVGPLFDIEVAPVEPMLVAMDVAGFTIFDITDPQNPVDKGYTLGDDFASTDMAISADGTRIVLLDAIDDEACVYEVANFVVQNAANPTCLSVGIYAQDVVITPDNNHALVLGGGGEGAIPPNFDSGSDTSITVLDLSANPPTVVGSYNLAQMAGYSIAPIPYDLIVGPDSGVLYVVTLDETISDFIDMVQEFLNTGDPLLLLQIIVFITTDGINFGGVIPINNPTDPALASIGTPMREAFTAPTAGDVLYSDGVAVCTSFSLDWDGGPVIQHGYSYANLNFGITTHNALEPEQDLSLSELLDLLVGLLVTGDVSIQP